MSPTNCHCVHTELQDIHAVTSHSVLSFSDAEHSHLADSAAWSAASITTPNKLREMKETGTHMPLARYSTQGLAADAFQSVQGYAGGLPRLICLTTPASRYSVSS